MEELAKLIQTIDILLGPNGCPWDCAQTLESMRSALMEESCELIEAIDLKEKNKICEELGDMIFLMLFLTRLAAKEGQCTLEEAVKNINEKLIRRHPHIFGSGENLDSPEAVKEQWDRIKGKEKKQKSLLDRIPKGLPSLARADELLQAMKKKKYPFKPVGEASMTEEQTGSALFALVCQAYHSKVEAEQALRKVLSQEEQKFRQWELEQE
jgi:tetrapyrrole methylase family protein/MazG family protein